MAAGELKAKDPTAGAIHCYHALATIEARLEGRRLPRPAFDDSYSCPLFVTLKKSDSRSKQLDLRGCIGTLSPTSLGNLGSFALKAAFEDRRFDPVQAAELPSLTCGVSFLINYEDAARWDDWEIGKHGIILEFTADGRPYSATYLPEVASEQGWDQEEAVCSLVRKAGFRRQVTSSFLDRCRVTRYQSSKFTVKWDDYVAATRAKGGDGNK